MDEIEFEDVVLRTRNPFVLTDHVASDAGDAIDLPAGFYRSATTPPPWLAVVVSEGLGGVKTARERRYGRFLAQHGCAALVIDSFAARGHAGSIHPVRAMNVTETMMVVDAFAGLRWLARHADVASDRIHHIGFSYGGMIATLTAYEQLRRHFIGEDPLRFAGHVSYYGPTVPRLEDPTTTGAPVTILNAERDANLNRERLDAIVTDLRRGGSRVASIIFPGAWHQWDSDDHERRFDPFNLHDGKTSILRDGTIVDETRGRIVGGYLSRLLMLARSVSLKGFHLRRDEAVMRRSDEILLATIGVDGRAAERHEVTSGGQRMEAVT